MELEPKMTSHTNYLSKEPLDWKNCCLFPVRIDSEHFTAYLKDMVGKGAWHHAFECMKSGGSGSPTRGSSLSRVCAAATPGAGGGGRGVGGRGGQEPVPGHGEVGQAATTARLPMRGRRRRCR